MDKRELLKSILKGKITKSDAIRLLQDKPMLIPMFAELDNDLYEYWSLSDKTEKRIVTEAEMKTICEKCDIPAIVFVKTGIDG